LKAFNELKKLVKEAGANYTDNELVKAIDGKGPIRCSLLPNWTIRKDLKCTREERCLIKARTTKDIRCALWLVKIAAEIRKKYWLEELNP
jgi:hypothetical protein